MGFSRTFTAAKLRCLFLVMLFMATSAVIFALLTHDYSRTTECIRGPFLDVTSHWDGRGEKKHDSTINNEVANESEDDYSQKGDDASLVFMRRFGHRRNIPKPAEIEQMSFKEVMYTLHSYLDNTDFMCKRKIRLGTVKDGGYETCDDYQYRPLQPCIVYSFGINYMWSFDDDVAKLYKCSVFSFDPSMKNKTHQRSDRIWFYKIGVGGNDRETSKRRMSQRQQRGWEIKTFAEIKEMLHHENEIIDILKIDIEDSEWPVLDNVLASGELRQVRQLLIELHLYQPHTFRNRLVLLQQLEAQGFRRFRTNVHAGFKQFRNDTIYPVQRGACYEMGFVNVNMARKIPT